MDTRIEDFMTFEKHMENISKKESILSNYVTLPRTCAEFEAFCEKVSKIAHQNSVLCS